MNNEHAIRTPVTVNLLPDEIVAAAALGLKTALAQTEVKSQRSKSPQCFGSYGCKTTGHLALIWRGEFQW